MGGRVAVLGLGRMGAALASTLLKSGYQVAVWNRTAAKMQPLVEAGALASSSPADALAGAETIILCVGSYADTLDLLGDYAGFEGRTVVQLTTGSRQEAESLRLRVEAAGGAFLAGGILAYPSQIGSRDTMLILAGAATAWESCAAIVRCLGGASMYTGEDFAAPSAMGFALAIPSLMASIGLMLGLHALERAGMDPAPYARSIAGLSRSLSSELERQAQAVCADRYEATEATLGTWAAAFRDAWVPDLIEAGTANGREVLASVLQPLGEFLTRGVTAGHGHEDLMSAIKVLRQP